MHQCGFYVLNETEQAYNIGLVAAINIPELPCGGGDDPLQLPERCQQQTGVCVCKLVCGESTMQLQPITQIQPTRTGVSMGHPLNETSKCYCTLATGGQAVPPVTGMYHIYHCNVRTGLTLNALALSVFAVYGDGETGPDLVAPLYGDPPLMAAVS